MNFEITEKLKTLPEKSGVYIMKNISGEVIYVGKAKILKNRVRQYFNNSPKAVKVSKMVDNIYDFEYIITDSEYEALILENNLIKEYMPKYNILLKDDKTYPFIKITLNEDYPSLYLTRKVLPDGSKYFGPYCSSQDVKELINLINDIFKLKKCKKVLNGEMNYKKPCLYKQMNKCYAPCCNMISKSEYRKIISDVISFLNGKYNDIITKLNSDMNKYASSFDFENAAILRDRINSVSILSQKQKVVSANSSDYDAISLFNENNFASVYIFFIRRGKIVGKEQYFMNNTFNSDDSEILSEFIKQYYRTSSFIPLEILCMTEIDDNDNVEKWLKETTKKSVKISVPKIGDKYKLISMITLNAKKSHREKSLKDKRNIDYKNNSLIELQSILKMDKAPLIIEAYDISNISGSFNVGAMVTFKNASPYKKGYRNFKIKFIDSQDDYASMSQVLSRRIERGLKEKEEKSDNFSFYPLPDLILIDGGVNHVSVCREVLNKYELDIPVFGIVKDDTHSTDALTDEKGKIYIDKSSYAFMLLTSIQDEVHRRAITYHRLLREKSSFDSQLSNIANVGDKKAKILLKKYKSIKKIKEASLEELMNIDGIDKRSAQNIYTYFNSK